MKILEDMVKDVFEGLSGGDNVRVQTTNRLGTQMQSSLLQAPCTVVIETSKRKIEIKIRPDGTLERVRKNEK